MKRFLVISLFIIFTVGMTGCNEDYQKRHSEKGVQEETLSEKNDNKPTEESTSEEEKAFAGKVEEIVEDASADENGNDQEASESEDAKAELEETWKNAYIPIVKEWMSLHYGDESLAYNLTYINDDDIPEMVLTCDDGPYVGIDVYTIINGAVRRLEYEDGVYPGPFVRMGCQGQGDTYIEKGGIWLQHSCMMGSYWVSGYRIEGNVLTEIFTYNYNDESWNETAEIPYSYNLSYYDKDWKEVCIEKEISEEDYYFDVSDIPEASELEERYYFSFDDEKTLEGGYSYEDMCDILGIENRESSDNEKYAILLNQFMKDSNNDLYDNLDCTPYYEGMKFALKDIDHDGRAELLIENNLFVPGDDWGSAQIGKMDFYDEKSGMYARIDGDLGGSITYYKLIGDEEEIVDIYSWVDYDLEDFADTLYYHGVDPSYGDGGVEITEEEYMSQPCYSWTNHGEYLVDADYHEINVENIKKYLIMD